MHKIILLNGHRLCLDAMCQFISFCDENYNVFGVSNKDDLFEITQKGKSDLLIVDIDENPLLEKYDSYAKKIIFLIDKDFFTSDLKQSENVKGVLSKNISGQELRACILKVLNGEECFENFEIEILKNPKKSNRNILDTLTKREREILKYLAQGDSNKQISKALFIEISTVKLHVRSVCKKLRVSNRTKAALFLKESTWN